MQHAVNFLGAVLGSLAEDVAVQSVPYCSVPVAAPMPRRSGTLSAQLLFHASDACAAANSVGRVAYRCLKRLPKSRKVAGRSRSDFDLLPGLYSDESRSRPESTRSRSYLRLSCSHRDLFRSHRESHVSQREFGQTK